MGTVYVESEMMSFFSSTDLAYLAGIIDGEGTIRVKKVRASGRDRSSTYRAHLSVGNTSKDMIEWLRVHFGGSVHSRVFAGRWRRMWVWDVNLSSMEQVLESVRMYLVCKQPQADEVLAFLRGGVFGVSNEVGKRGFKRTPPEEIARREHHYQRTRQLNRRGEAVESVA